MGSVVARWTGLEARALREAKRMSVREFAAHLGVNDAAVSNWERRGTKAKLRYDTQQLLDTDLTRSGPDVSDRFELILRVEATDKSSTPNSLQDETSSAGATHLGDRSGQRTAALLDASRTDTTELRYQPDQAAVERFQQFLGSQARVFVLTGGAGSGKTQLTQHLAHRWSNEVDFQFHACSTWALPTTNLATEILRYASLPSGEDSLLTLEHVSDSLERPGIIVIDGVDTEEQLTVVGRHVNGILRQAGSNHLRFLIVARTPPGLDLSTFPVLSAATFGHGAQSSPASHTMQPWTLAEARELWDHEHHAGQISFAGLPESLRSLVRTPLYMRILRSAGDTAPTSARPGTINAFRLVDHCVRTVLGHNVQNIGSGGEPDHFTRLASELMPESAPDPLVSTAQRQSPHHGRPSTAPVEEATAAFIERASDGRERFTHDVFREYFLALRIVEQMTTRGRSATTIASFNDLASHGARSAAARGVFDFVVCALDRYSPDLLEVIAMAPSISLDTTLPMLFETTAANGVLMPDEVVRSCARRCAQVPARQLARTQQATPNITKALGDQHAPWVVEQLRTHGFKIWNDVSRHVEETLDIRVSTHIASCIDLDQPEEAAFLACHFDLFTGADNDHSNLLQQLLQHLDWRVRAGLAEALLGDRVLGPTHVNHVVKRLVHDDDYKVRAAVAKTVGTLDAATAHDHVRELLADSNWHVRERTLQGLLAGPRAPLPDPELTRTVIAHVAGDRSWDAPLAHAAKLLSRIRLLNWASLPTHDAPPPDDGALFGLLREVRAGWIGLPSRLEQSLVSHGLNSSHWFTAREARTIQQRHTPRPGGMNVREQYRRRRGQRSVQVALDVHSLDHATSIATAAIAAGVDFIEIGDPLIKRVGVTAIEVVKRHAPETAVVAEMMSADWGRDQVELAAEAGADVVLLIGPATIASVSAAVTAARRLGVALTLDVPSEHLNPSWLRDMERTGVDGFVVTTNIDLGVGGNHPLATARMIRAHSQLPVAVSGGFSTADDALAHSGDWDIAIVGRSITDAVAPADMAHQLTTIVRKIHPEERP